MTIKGVYSTTLPRHIHFTHLRSRVMVRVNHVRVTITSPPPQPQPRTSSSPFLLPTYRYSVSIAPHKLPSSLLSPTSFSEKRESQKERGSLFWSEDHTVGGPTTPLHSDRDSTLLPHPTPFSERRKRPQDKGKPVMRLPVGPDLRTCKSELRLHVWPMSLVVGCKHTLCGKNFSWKVSK